MKRNKYIQLCSGVQETIEKDSMASSRSEKRPQGIMVVVFIKTNFQSKMIPRRRVSWGELGIAKVVMTRI